MDRNGLDGYGPNGFTNMPSMPIWLTWTRWPVGYVSMQYCSLANIQLRSHHTSGTIYNDNKLTFLERGRKAEHLEATLCSLEKHAISAQIDSTSRIEPGPLEQQGSTSNSRTTQCSFLHFWYCTIVTHICTSKSQHIFCYN